MGGGQTGPLVGTRPLFFLSKPKPQCQNPFSVLRVQVETHSGQLCFHMSSKLDVCGAAGVGGAAWVTFLKYPGFIVFFPTQMRPDVGMFLLFCLTAAATSTTEQSRRQTASRWSEASAVEDLSCSCMSRIFSVAFLIRFTDLYLADVGCTNLE